MTFEYANDVLEGGLTTYAEQVAAQDGYEGFGTKDGIEYISELFLTAENPLTLCMEYVLITMAKEKAEWMLEHPSLRRPRLASMSMYIIFNLTPTQATFGQRKIVAIYHWEATIVSTRFVIILPSLVYDARILATRSPVYSMFNC